MIEVEIGRKRRRDRVEKIKGSVPCNWKERRKEKMKKWKKVRKERRKKGRRRKMEGRGNRKGRRRKIMCVSGRRKEGGEEDKRKTNRKGMKEGERRNGIRKKGRGETDEGEFVSVSVK